ncbi:MAG: RsmE family RNA methyltransferase [Candidatus Omnitrophica bacterium]|nr:RsmE family RNA methyltransferase [Candidatus Omnitrophota bacterium]MDD5592883.1 RsmE family RNA methyltransferase [Candidatus Omnitrophota bacterium]
MHRLYSPAQNISSVQIIVDNKEQVHHARDVLRLKIKEKVIIFDDKGIEYCCILEKILPQSLVFAIWEKTAPGLKEMEKIRITVACAIPKASHMDGVIDKLTQLGVERIIPMETERVIIKLDKRKKILRLKRWEKIALNASLQSHRNGFPVIGPVKGIREVLSDAQGFDLKLIPALIGERESLRETIIKSNPKNILVLIGPEGDFTQEELDFAKSRGCLPVSLGDLVLRVETAAVAAVSFIRLYADS